MKKVLLTIGLAAAASISYGQGLITFDTFAAAQKTNTTVSTYAPGYVPNGNGAATAGVTGATVNVANSFYYTLLIASSSPGTQNPANVGWTQALFTPSGGVQGGIMGTNEVGAGDAEGPKGVSSTAIDNWAGGATMSYEIVGWSANLGSTWAVVLAELNANWVTLNPNSQYYFGTSAIGSGTSGVPPTGTALNVWGTAPVGAFTMNQVGAVAVIPEPTTMALAGLGGLSLLALRRKK